MNRRKKKRIKLAHAINMDFSAVKLENFIGKKIYLAKNCGYTLEYQQPMFWIKNKKKMGIPM